MEWLIDIILEKVGGVGYALKAWVLAKAYASEAWVEARLYTTVLWVTAQIHAMEIFFLEEIGALRAYLLEEIAALKTWVQNQNYLQHGFVDRGDPAVWDWSRETLAQDSAWHDLDLSAIVPVDTKGVAFNVFLKNTFVNKEFYLRRKGNVNIIVTSSKRTQVANVVIRADLTCACDENRKIQYWITANGWTSIYLVVKGWWF